MASPNPVMRMSTKMTLRMTRTPRLEAAPPASVLTRYIEWTQLDLLCWEWLDPLEPVRSRVTTASSELTELIDLKLTLLVLLESFSIPLLGLVSAVSSSMPSIWILQVKVQWNG